MLRQLQIIFLVTFPLFGAPVLRGSSLATGTAQVRQVPAVNGGATVEGSIHMMTGGAVNLNGGAVITGDLLVPGTPVVRLNGNPVYAGTVDGGGPATPSNYTITLNGGASLGHVVRRTAPVTLASVPPPSAPAGARSVNINTAAQSPGDWATLRNLTLNGNVGQFTVPAGAYGDFTANGGSGFTLGVAGASQPAVYHFQRLTLNGQSQVRVLGPVIVNLAAGFNANGEVGSADRPEWLTLNIAGGGLNLNGGSALHASLNAPASSVIINGNSRLVGRLIASSLIVNGGGLLRLLDGGTTPPANTAPVAAGQALAATEDTPLSLTLAATDAEGDTLTYTVVTPPAHGTLGGTAPSLTYAPAADYHGTDSFTFKARDGALDSDIATIALSIAPVNDAPSATPRTLATDEDTPFALTLSGTDAEGGALAYVIVTPPTHGTLTLAPGSSPLAPDYVYVPVANYHGPDAFTFLVNDGGEPALDSSPAPVNLTVTSVNDAPAAQSLTLAVAEGEQCPVTLAGSDADDDALTYTLLSAPGLGSLGGTAPNLVYTPPANTTATATFSYRVNDGTLDSAPALVSIAITDRNHAPVATHAALTVTEDTPLVITLDAADADGDALVYALHTPPAQGVVTLAGNVATYTPSANATGEDAFTFTATDGLLTSSPGTISLTITPVNDTPVAAPQTLATDEDAPLSFTLSGTDAEGDALAYAILTLPAHGTLSGTAPHFTYTPAADYHGTDMLVFTAADGAATSLPAALAITVNPVNDAPVATGQTLAVNEGDLLAIMLTASDADGDTLAYAVLAPPALGTLTLAPGAPVGGPGYVFTPPANTTGTASFTFRASDGTAESNAASIVISFTNLNDAPVATAAAVECAEDAAVSFGLTGTDPDSDALSFELASPPAHGSVSLTGHLVTYTPAADFNGTDSFTFTATDQGSPALTSAPATISVTVTPLNDAPTALAQTATTAEDTPLALTLAGADVDGDSLAYVVTSAPAHGTLGGSAPHLTYTPAADYHGGDVFAFTVSDGVTVSAPATVTLTITPVNDAPVAQDQTLVVAANTGVTFTLAGTDPEGTSPLVYAIAGPAAHGVLGGVAPSLTYQPDYGYSGTDLFTFTASDGEAVSAPATVTITVTPPVGNQSPVITLETPGGPPLPLTAFELVAVARDADGQVARVDYLVNGSPLGHVLAPVAGDPTRFALLIERGLPAGTYSLTARVTDDEGASTLSAPLALTIDYDPRAHSFTRTADFEGGTLVKLKSADDELTTTFQLSALSYVWVSNSTAGTVVRIEAETGRVVGVYRAAPAGSASFPSSIAVDSEGNAWVANRSGNSIVKIGLGLDNGGWVDRDHNEIPTTSTGQGDILPWVNGQDPVDENILLSVQTAVRGLDHIAVDANDNVWVGGYGGDWQLFDGKTGDLLRREDYPGVGGRGGFIDAEGIQVSTGYRFMRWDTSRPATEYDPTFAANVLHQSWGVARDAAGNYWVTKDASPLVEKYSATGEKLGAYPHGSTWGQGIVIDGDGHIWIAHSHCGDTVGHLLPDGTWIGNVKVAAHGPTEVSADGRGRIWVVSTTGVVERINPLGGPVGRDGVTPVGEVDLRSPQLGGTLWTYGKFTGSRQAMVLETGEWRFDYDSQIPSAAWGPVLWNALLANDAVVRVEVGFSEDGQAYGGWETLSPESPVPAGTGRHVRGRVTFVPSEVGDSPVLLDLTVGTAGYRAPVIPNRWLVRAGEDQSATWPDKVQLKGASWHSAHAWTGTPSYQWTFAGFAPLATGAGQAPVGGAVVFSDPADPRSKATFSGTGEYRLRLTATLNGVSSSDEVIVRLTPYNKLPYVSANSHLFLRDAAETALLDGIVRDDGLPLGGALVSTWEKAFGPGEVAFADAHAPVTTATFGEPGIYVLRLRASDGELESVSGMSVYAGLVCTEPPPQGLISWWQANGGGSDHISGNQAFPEQGAGFAEGYAGPAFSFDGTNDRVHVFGNDTMDVGMRAGLGLEFWVRPSESRESTLMEYGVNAGTRGVSVRQSGANLVIDFKDTAGVSHLVSLGSALPVNTWTHLSINYDRASGWVHVFRNGTWFNAQSIGSFALQTSYDFRLGASWAGDRFFKGLLDEVSLYERALSHAEAWKIHAEGPAGKRRPVTNAAPSVDAGGAYVVPAAAAPLGLRGVVTDDGLPSYQTVRSQWSVLSLPAGAAVAFADASAPSTTATFSDPGLYTLQLYADDGAFCTRRSVDVRVAAFGASAVPDGLLAWWPGNQTTEDVVSGLFAAPVSLGYAAGAVGGAFSFDGGTTYLAVAARPATDLARLPDGFSIEFWVKDRSTTSGDRRLLSWREAGVEKLRVIRNNAGGYFKLSTGADTLQVPAAVSANWMHVVFAYDGAGRRLACYVDGILKASLDASAYVFATEGELTFGGSPVRPAAEWFKGEIDELSFYGRPLSAAEVIALHAGGLLGKEPLDDNEAPDVDAGPDAGVAALDGTAALEGVVSDDGKPAGGFLRQEWTQVFGPAPASIASPQSARTTATFTAGGLYGFRLAADDGRSLRSDTMEVRVASPVEHDAPSGLLAWWPANATAEEVVSGRTSASHGLSYRAGAAGAAFDFDGNAYVHEPGRSETNLGALSAGFTIEFWMWPAATDANSRRLIAWNSGTAENLRIYSSATGASLTLEESVQINANTSELRRLALTGLPTGRWVHVALAYDKVAKTLTFYVDGVVKQTSDAAGLPMKTQGDLTFGNSFAQASANGFKGGLDEVSFYDHPLTGADIIRIFTAGQQGKRPVTTNTPPLVFAGVDQELATNAGSVTLSGRVSDDGLPAAGGLTTTWTQSFGPAPVVLAHPEAAVTPATFTAPGIYGLTLTANDGLDTRGDSLEVRVGMPPGQAVPAGLCAWWPANASTEDVVSGLFGTPFNLHYMTGETGGAFSFDGNGYLVVPRGTATDLGALTAGFTVEFWMQSVATDANDRRLLVWSSGTSDGVRIYSSSSGTSLTVEEGVRINASSVEIRRISLGGVPTGRWVHVGLAYDKAAARLRFYIDGVLRSNASTSGIPLNALGDLHIGGSPNLTPANCFKGGLDEVSFYDRSLTADEIQQIFAAGTSGKAPLVRNRAPQVVAQAGTPMLAGVPSPLSGSALDDGLPNPPAALTYQWSKLSGPGDVTFSAAASPNTNATFETEGTYLVRLSVSDSELAGTADTLVVVSAPASQPPSITFVSPAGGTSLPASAAFELRVRATDADGSISRVEFFQGSTKLGSQNTSSDEDPSVYVWPLPNGLSAGTYVFSAAATDNSGVTVATDPVTVHVIADPGPPSAIISTPAEDARISAPVEFTGIVSSALLASWSLDCRLKTADGEPPAAWIPFSTGTSAAGQPGAPAPLGVLDPTLLINGLYEIRLTATDTVGRTVTEGPMALLVEGNMKVGAFSIAFNDLVESTPGLPITLARTYDSRDRRAGDFGPGWHLALGNIRVQKNRHLGNAWWQTPQSGDGFQFYDVLPINERLVTVVMPDGETHRFRAGAYVKNRAGDPDYSSFSVVVREGLCKFYPVGDTTSTLEPLDSDNQLYDRFWLEGTGDQDLHAGEYGDFDFTPYNPARFRLTTADGTIMLLDERLGLLELLDPVGNRLVVHRRPADGRIESIDSIQAHADGPITRTVEINRLPDGRVDTIEDLAGRTLGYLYDAQGRLASFTDRENNITQFRYELSDTPSHPRFSHLTRIIDPRGLPALRSEYDDDGRLRKQIDADGNETVFDRGVAAFGRFEKITDRLGHATTYFYDDRGNVTAKVDALGATTTYAYYPDSDRVKFEEDHYGNIKAFGYDDRGNVTTEILGASRTEEPATAVTGHITRTTYTTFSAPLSITDPDGRVQSFTYDPATQQLLTHTTGQLAPGASSEIIAATPATTTYAYHPDGDLWTVTDALGNVTTTTYTYGYADPAYPGAVKRVTTALVDPAGAPGSDPANAADTTLRTSYSYHDAQENVLATVTPRTLANGAIEIAPTRHAYDAENRLRFTLLPDGRIQETCYTSFGQTDKTLEWPAGTSLPALLAAGPTGPTTGARVTSLTYDPRGNVERTDYPDGSYEESHYDAENRREWMRDRNGNRTWYKYDLTGRLTHTYEPDATPLVANDGPARETIYDLIGRVQFEIDEEGATLEYTYENNCGCAMRRKSVIQHTFGAPGGDLVTEYDYDHAGNRTWVKDPRGNITETRYDSHGREVRTLYPATDEHPATQADKTYNVLGQRVAVTDQENRVTRNRYDALGRLVEVRQYLDQSLAATDSGFTLAATAPGIVSTRYAYDEIGNQLTQIDALGRITSYAYDSSGRRTTRTLPLASSEISASVETTHYNAWGVADHRIDFNGHRTDFEHDELNRLRAKIATDHPSRIHAFAAARVEYDLDPLGQRTGSRVFNADGMKLYEDLTPRDARGRIDEKTITGGAAIDYDYYANNLLKSVASDRTDGVNLVYGYDVLNRLETVMNGGGGRTTDRTDASYTYNAAGSQESVTYANGIRHHYTYDTLNRLRGLIVGQTAGLEAPAIATVLHSYDYRLKRTGHRREVVEGPVPSGPFRTTTYAYDELYRLTGETVAGGGTGISPVGSVSYTLDKVGNRESRTSTMATVTGIADYDYDARDRLTTIDGRSLDYSRAGSTTAGTVTDLGLDGVTGGPLATLGSGTTYTDVYDFEERLIQRTYADGSQVIVTYDADGFRVGKTILSSASALISTTSYLVCTNNLTGYAQVLEERTTSADGNDVRIYSYGSDLIGQDRQDPASGAWAYSFYGYDGHGSVCELFDDAGQITDTYAYDAFGVITARTGTTPNHYRYAGEQFDEDLGLFYNRARYLNLNTGRFWSMDEYEGQGADPVSLHKYVFANGDPVMLSDPSGQMSLGEITTAQNINANNQRMAVPRVVNTLNNFRRSWCRITEKTIWQAHHLIGLSFGGKGSRAAARTTDLAKGLTAKMSKELHGHYHQLLNKALKMMAGLPGNTKRQKILNMIAAGELSTEELKAAMLAATGTIDTGCLGVPGYQPLTPRLLKQFADQGF